MMTIRCIAEYIKKWATDNTTLLIYNRAFNYKKRETYNEEFQREIPSSPYAVLFILLSPISKIPDRVSIGL